MNEHSHVGTGVEKFRGAGRDLLLLFLACDVLAGWLYTRSWPVELRALRAQVAEARVMAVLGPRAGLLFTRQSGESQRAVDVLARARRRDPGSGEAINHLLFFSAAGGLAGAVVSYPFLLARRRGGGRGDKHLRGAQIVPAWRLRLRLMIERGRDRLLGRAPDKKPITIGGLAIPAALEPLHFVLSGGTGSGKTQTILSIMRPVRVRAERLICTDSGGNLMAAMAQKGDRLLNPLDARSVKWSPFSEMNNAWDADRIATSMIPSGNGEAGEWHRYAQSLVAGVLLRLWESGLTTNERLLYWLTVAPVLAPAENPADENNLAALVAGLPVARLFTAGADKMLGSVLGIIGAYMAPYSKLDPAAGAEDFSIRKWIQQEEEGSNWLWMPYSDDQSTTLRPLLSAWMAIAVSAVLSLRASRERRIWAVMDELASLGRVNSLSDALTKGRKYGLCCVAGIQSISQLREHYGSDGAETLLSCLSTVLVLRTPNEETAKYLSSMLGRAEVRRENRARSEGRETISEQRGEPHIVMDSEIRKLPDREGYLDLAGDYPIARVKIPLTKTVECNKPFIPRQSG